MTNSVVNTDTTHNEHTPPESRADQSPAHHLPLSGGTCRAVTSIQRGFLFGAA